MGALTPTVRRIDRWQRGNRGAAITVAVLQKYRDDQGGSLAALLTYYGFLSLFPLLLLALTVVGLVTGGNEAAVARVEHSALAQFPVIGSRIGDNLHTLHDRAGIGLVVSLVGLLWGSLGIARVAQRAMADVWDVALVDRRHGAAQAGRSLVVVAAVGGSVVVGTVLAGAITIGRHGLWSDLGSVAVSTTVNVLVYTVAFRLLTPLEVRWRSLWPGAVVGGVGWTGLLYLGGALVGHSLRHTSQIYGFFAVVLGLLAWIVLGCQLALVASELNSVLCFRLWPRSLCDPMTEADRRSLAGVVTRRRSRRDQHVEVGFDAGATDPPPAVTDPEPDCAGDVAGPDSSAPDSSAPWPARAGLVGALAGSRRTRQRPGRQGLRPHCDSRTVR